MNGVKSETDSAIPLYERKRVKSCLSPEVAGCEHAG